MTSVAAAAASAARPLAALAAALRRPSTWPVLLFVPNLIGYVRVVAALAAFASLDGGAGGALRFASLYALSYLLDAVDGPAARALKQATAFGALLESFVFAEVLKLMTGSDLRLTPWHFRDGEMREVDIVLERDDGMIVGIEVKASATVRPGDFAGMKVLAQACGDRFAFGVVLYDGAEVVPFGDRLAAAPLSCLWR